MLQNYSNIEEIIFFQLPTTLVPHGVCISIWYKKLQYLAGFLIVIYNLFYILTLFQNKLSQIIRNFSVDCVLSFKFRYNYFE